MELETALKNLPKAETPSHLKSVILARLSAADAARHKVRREVFGALSIISALSVPAALWYAYAASAHSAFGAYVSLLATDGGAALSNWREFALSLLESAPLFGVTLALGAAFAFLLFARGFASAASSRNFTRITA